jgi:hypothetical protein
MLVRLLYASRSVDTSTEAIESILSQARQHNPVSGITGILCYGGGIFLQAIEGGRMQVSELFGTIMKDARHKDVALLHFEEISERRFGGWTMGQVNLNKLNHSHPPEVLRAGRARSVCHFGQGLLRAAGRPDGHRLHLRPGLSSRAADGPCSHGRDVPWIPLIVGCDFSSSPTRASRSSWHWARCRLARACCAAGAAGIADASQLAGAARAGWAASTFPFGLPRELVEQLGLAAAWRDAWRTTRR